MKLDENQRLAVKTIDGPLMIVSCAGSGKTTVILEKINEIIKKNKKPHRILATTFSKAAAEEMEERFKDRYGYDEVMFSTIHSICLGILRSYFSISMDAVLLNKEKSTFIYDSFSKYIRKNSNFSDLTYEEFSSEIELYMSQQLIDEYLGVQSNNQKNVKKKEIYSKIFKDYRRYKNQIGKIDFDDMIVSCHQSLKKNPDILEKLKNRYDYYLIDEFQDVNLIQAEIFYMLSSRTKNICVVGDDDQSIYGFRGVDSQIFQNFKSTYPQAQTIYLNKNYRSLPFIIEGASKLIVNNEQRIPKKFFTNRIGLGEISINEESSLSHEIINIVDMIKDLHAEGQKYRDIGVLYRVNRLASGLIALLDTENIPYYTSSLVKDIHSGMVFGDITAYYRLAMDYGTQNDLMTIINRPTRYLKKNKLQHTGLNKKEIISSLIKEEKAEYKIDGIVKNVDQLFKDLSKLQQLKPVDFIDYLNYEMNYVESLNATADYLNKNVNTWKDNFFILQEESKKYETFEEWLTTIVRKNQEKRRELEKNKKKGIYLSTFHGAKGLQWKNVFIIAANEGITPHFEATKVETKEARKEIEEERRLFYVAMTRAMDRLTISYNNDGKFSQRSRFLAELSGK